VPRHCRGLASKLDHAGLHRNPARAHLEPRSAVERPATAARQDGGDPGAAPACVEATRRRRLHARQRGCATTRIAATPGDLLEHPPAHVAHTRSLCAVTARAAEARLEAVVVRWHDRGYEEPVGPASSVSRASPALLRPQTTTVPGSSPSHVLRETDRLAQKRCADRHLARRMRRSVPRFILPNTPFPTPPLPNPADIRASPLLTAAPSSISEVPIMFYPGHGCESQRRAGP